MTTTCNGVMPSYPMVVLRACAAVSEAEAFKELPDSCLRIVITLIKMMDVMTPRKAIFARRKTLADRCGKSVETVGRALRWLEEEGFITREQVTRQFLRGSDSPITPTAKLINALGFGKQPKRPSVNNEGSLSAVQNQSNIHKQCDQSPDRQPSLVDNSSVHTRDGGKRIDGVKIPEDLVILHTQGKLSGPAILKLMKQARKAGNFLLSDVIASVKINFEKIYSHGLYAYVLSLLYQNKDYKWIARQLRDKAAMEHSSQQALEMLERKRLELQGRRFRDSDGRIYQVRGEWLEITHKGESKLARFGEKFVQDVQEGVYISCAD